TGNVKGKAHGVHDMATNIRCIRRHPADVHRRFDSRIESGEQETSITTDREADATESPAIDFGPAREVIKGPEIVPQDYTGPRDPGRHQRAGDEWFVLARTAIERLDFFGRHALRLTIRRRIVVEQHAAFA